MRGRKNITMKNTFLAGVLAIMMISLTACDGNGFLDVHTSYYSNLTATGEGNEYEISGTAEIVDADTLGLVYISAMETTNVDLSGELKAVSGDTQIIYINADNKETVIYDSSDNAK